MIKEGAMIEELRRGRVSLPPLSFRFLKSQPMTDRNRRFDALIEASWGDNTVKFAVECKPLSTPMAFRDGLNQLKSALLPKGCQPLLMMPFLREEQLRELEMEGISGIDLCGNGVIVVKGAFAVFRGGATNRFPSSAPIKNIYRKNSSMVGRMFLVRPNYETVQGIRSEINLRNPLVNRWDKKPMGLSTVSKALKTLEEDLIVARNDTIRLLQPDKLLEKLSGNYVSPTVTQRVRLSVPQQNSTIYQTILNQAEKTGLPFMAAGISSVGRYAVMQRGEPLTVYCPRLELLLDRLAGTQTERFPNLELIETEDETVYFDFRKDGDFIWASPVQTYLELMAGDKRDQETAAQVRSFILAELQQEKR